MALSRALWIDAGHEPDFTKAKREQMTALFLPVSDPMDDLRRRAADIRSNGMVVGAYMAYNDGWPQFWGHSGKDVAQIMYGLVAQIGGKVKTQFDLEPGSANLTFVLETLTRYRALSPTADTSWTTEGHQGGTMSTEFVQAVVALHVRVVPQCYGASMEDTWDTLEMARNLTARGFPDALISPFHDAAKLPKWWTGFAFTQNRLP
jgi:hypothetical protein